ncbi:ABC transporter substrate-binding protein [Stomatohabitans albus]|uniref:ABC transporter substrate-binding protein n=1 Tax=Stomatohabitans albus TaxID=3110766 RepID=UPI00300C0973
MTKRWALATLPFAVLLAACSSNAAPSGSESASAAPTTEASASASADMSETAEASESSATTAAAYPVTIENCGLSITYEKAPERAITMNQGATEVMLALGLEKQMAGTAYLDDTAISDRFKAAYDQVPVIAEKYPTFEQFLAAKPDFAYASYQSAFSEKNNKERPALKDDGINTYVSDFGCDQDKDQPASWERVNDQIMDIAKIFGQNEKGEMLVKDMTATLDKVKDNKAGKGAKVVWWDSGKTDAPFVAGGTGGPQLLMDAVGLENAFKSEQSNWFNGTWENFVAADPDWIVLADASWDTAQSKIEHAKADPVLKELRAVKEDKFVTLPFSQTTPGVTLVDGVESLDKQLSESK